MNTENKEQEKDTQNFKKTRKRNVKIKILAAKLEKKQVLKNKISFYFVICDLRKQKTMKGYILLNPKFKKLIYEDA